MKLKVSIIAAIIIVAMAIVYTEYLLRMINPIVQTIAGIIIGAIVIVFSCIFENFRLYGQFIKRQGQDTPKFPTIFRLIFIAIAAGNIFRIAQILAQHKINMKDYWSCHILSTTFTAIIALYMLYNSMAKDSGSSHNGTC